MSRPAGLTFPGRQVPQSQLPRGIRGDQAGQRLGVFGQTGQTVSVAVKGAKERLGEDPLQFDGVHGPLIFPLSLERMQLWTGMWGVNTSTAAQPSLHTYNFCSVCGCRAWIPGHNPRVSVSVPSPSWWFKSNETILIPGTSLFQ